MALTPSSTYTIHHYPEYIRQDEFKNRKIEITAIANESIDGITQTGETKLSTMQSNFDAIKGNNYDIWAASRDAPSDIDSTNIVQNTKKIMNGTQIYTAVLPLPNELQDRSSNIWNNENSSTIMDLIKTSGETVTSAIGKTVSKAFENKDGSFSGKIKNKLGDIGAKLYKEKGGLLNEASAILGFRKPMLDPGFFASYNGTKPRSFDLSFDFVPNNAFEAKNILNIILNLKKFSTPRSTINGVSLMAPYFFDIKFGHEKLQKLINLSNVVITSLDVNYSGDGNVMLFADGTPMYIKLNIGFMEVLTVTSEFY